MRRFMILGVLILAGCQSTVGPFQARSPERVDSPYVSLSEQEARARNRWAMPDDAKGRAAVGNEFLGWK